MMTQKQVRKTKEGISFGLKVLLGILGEDETVLLSTHLLEEVSGFIGRAVLLHQGRIKGDVSMSELEEQGVSLMDYVKSAWNYRADRIRSAIEELSGEDGQT